MEDILRDYLPEVILVMYLILAVVIVGLIYIIIQNKSIKLDRSYEVEDALNSSAISLETNGVNHTNKEMSIEEDEAVVAAIIAAICTYSGMSADQFSIRSIKVINSSGSNWRRQSLIS